MIYMFIHVNIQTGGWFCRGFDCQIPTAKNWKDTEPEYNISETIGNIVKLYFSVDKILKKETLPLTTKNWAVVYNFIGTHFQSDQNVLKQNERARANFNTQHVNSQSANVLLLPNQKQVNSYKERKNNS